MSFHSMRELVIWHGERGLLWQLGPGLAGEEAESVEARPAGAPGISPAPHPVRERIRESDGPEGDR